MRKWIIIGVMLLSVSAFAQPPDRNYMRGPTHRPPEQLETLRIWKMTEFLELSEEQATQFFPALRIHREKIREIDSTEIALQRKIAEEIVDNSVDQKYVDAKIAQLIELRQKKRQMEEKFLANLPEYLIPEQQAKFLIFDQHFRRALREAIRRHEPRDRFKQ